MKNEPTAVLACSVDAASVAMSCKGIVRRSRQKNNILKPARMHVVCFALCLGKRRLKCVSFRIAK